MNRVLAAFAFIFVAPFHCVAQNVSMGVSGFGGIGAQTNNPITMVFEHKQTQTLADGTHINIVSHEYFYRDNLGRTRTESEFHHAIFWTEPTGSQRQRAGPRSPDLHKLADRRLKRHHAYIQPDRSTSAATPSDRRHYEWQSVPYCRARADAADRCNAQAQDNDGATGNAGHAGRVLRSFADHHCVSGRLYGQRPAYHHGGATMPVTRIRQGVTGLHRRSEDRHPQHSAAVRQPRRAGPLAFSASAGLY